MLVLAAGAGAEPRQRRLCRHGDAAVRAAAGGWGAARAPGGRPVPGRARGAPRAGRLGGRAGRGAGQHRALLGARRVCLLQDCPRPFPSTSFKEPCPEHSPTSCCSTADSVGVALVSWHALGLCLAILSGMASMPVDTTCGAPRRTGTRCRRLHRRAPPARLRALRVRGQAAPALRRLVTAAAAGGS